MEIDLDGTIDEQTHEVIPNGGVQEQVIPNEQVQEQVIPSQVVQPESNTSTIPNDDEVVIHARPVNFRDNLINSLLKKNK